MICVTQEQWIDVQNDDEVRAFVQRYLKTHSRPPSDDEVHNVTVAIARYKGPAMIKAGTLESFLAGLLGDHRPS